MMRLSTVLALLFSLLAAPLVGADGLPVAKPEQVGLSSERLARIGAVLRADVERGRIPGAVVLVARKGRIAYLEAVGFRDKTAGAPMTPEAIFRLASMTKPMVTVAAMTLYETVDYMTSDHLGPSISRGASYSAGPGYTWGLGFAVRQDKGIAPIAGSAGDFYWPGAFATYWWADPKEEMIVVSMMQSPLGRHYSHLLRGLVLQAIAE